MPLIRMAQYGTKHGHAAGKLMAMQRSPDVDLAGVYEPDPARRRELESGDGPFGDANWFDDERGILDDPAIVAVASEGRNIESLDHTGKLVRAGKHVWYDKPAGDNWEQWRDIVALAGERGLRLQMGYMFRYHEGFMRIADWARSGLLGDLFAIRANMSTRHLGSSREIIGRHAGGILYDLAGHMLDQITWLLGRPLKVTSFLRNDGPPDGLADNTLGVFEYERAMAFVDIAAMETRPMARRFEVYGTQGSAIMEPIEPAPNIRLCLDEDRGEYREGAQLIPLGGESRSYDKELVAFLASISGGKPPDRPLEHELLVQETLLRATGGIPGG